MLDRLTRRLWRRVHPDLFARWPTAQSVNQRSMQELRALLEASGEQQASFRSGAVPPPRIQLQELRFFVREEDVLREISTTWTPPPLLVPSASPIAHANRWQRSTEGLVAALLRRIDGELPAELTAAEATTVAPETDDDHGPTSHAGESVTRAAAAAAARRRSRAAESTPSGQPQRAMDGGGELRRDLLFFHAVPEEARPRAVAQLVSLIHQVLPAGVSHGPILLCGGPPPPAARQDGFACVSVDGDAAALQRSLAEARRSAGAYAAADRRADGEAIIASGRRLRALLSCEGVRTEGALEPHVALSMYRSLLDHARSLRVALDVPWGGLHVRLEGSGDDGGAAGERAVAHGATASPHEIIDGRCGGCVLVVRGEGGAAGALSFVRREWLQLRRGQERFSLAEELRTRLGCAAVECLGAPTSTAEQCAALRRLLGLLHSTPVLLPQEDGRGLADVVLTIGDEPTTGGAPFGGVGGDTATSVRRHNLRSHRGCNGSHRHGSSRHQRTELHVPSSFDAQAVLNLLVCTAFPNAATAAGRGADVSAFPSCGRIRSTRRPAGEAAGEQSRGSGPATVQLRHWPRVAQPQATLHDLYIAARASLKDSKLIARRIPDRDVDC